MIQKEDRWIMEEIFRLSDQALVRMINGLFGTEYQDEEKIWKEWRDQEALSVCLKVGGMNRYEFSLRRLDGCLQICAENRGNIFVYEKMAVGDVMQIREPQILYFGKKVSIFLDDLNFQIIKIDGFDETVPGKAGLIITLEIRNIYIQPDGGGEVKLMTDLVQSMEDLMRTGVSTAILQADILQNMIAFNDFCPHTKHKRSPCILF